MCFLHLLLFYRRLSCILFAIVVLATICCKANASKIVNVECAESLAKNPHVCFIEQRFEYDYGDNLRINGIINDTQQANQIFELVVTYYAKLQSIPPQLWKQLPHLEHLNLRGTKLETIHEIDFENAWNLYNLTLSYNNLKFIPTLLFSRAVKLMEIDLAANHIQKIDDYAFNGLHQLYYLSLSRNHIVTLTANVFSGAPHLIDLRLDNNALVTLEPGVFELPDLLFLYLNDNQLMTLPDDCFKHTQLIGLDLTQNDLERVGNAIYTPNTLRTLLLTSNRKINDLNVTRISKDLKKLTTFKHDPDLQLLT